MEMQKPYVCVRCGERLVSNHHPDNCQNCGSVSVVPDRWTEYDYDTLNHAAAERAYCDDSAFDANFNAAFDAAFRDSMRRPHADVPDRPVLPWWALIAAASVVVWTLAWLGISDAAMADCETVASFDTCFYTLNR